MAALNIPIQLVGACSTLGDMTPLWFRYENEEHAVVTVKVEEVVSSKEERYCGMDYISFVCWAAAEGRGGSLNCATGCPPTSGHCSGPYHRRTDRKEDGRVVVSRGCQQRVPQLERCP